MIEGNQTTPVEIKKSRLAIQVAMRKDVKELAQEYGLSSSVMKQALIEAGFWKARGDAKEVTPQEEDKLTITQEAALKFELTEDEILQIVEFLGLKLKTEKAKRGNKRYKIIDDIVNQA
jgi:excinuclease UvrABC helicase subunit UvrB